MNVEAQSLLGVGSLKGKLADENYRNQAHRTLKQDLEK
jgi:hypothetical protein